MTQALTYVEIDIPAFTQNSPPDSPLPMTTFRFAVNALYLPSSIDCIPSIKAVSITPAIISLGENLGQRASVTVTFKDHRHIFAGEDFESGTFWGKFRARYGLKLRGFSLRVINGIVGNDIDDMETRHFIIDSTDGPTSKGEYKIIAKDVLKLADGDRAQAPVLNNGFLLAAITNVQTTATLTPTGIGNEEYGAAGFLAIGGTEIVSYTRAADALTITRAQFNTVAVAHDAGDRLQECITYTALDPPTIINDLLVAYAGVPQAYSNPADWQIETDTYLGSLYTAVLAEPTSVNKLISELIEQAGLVMWWDDIGQNIRMQVLREISSAAALFDEDNIIADSIDVKEQPEKRVSQVYVYFAKINPLVKEDQLDNYRSTAFAQDEDTEAEYGSPSIKKIFSRWIPAGGRSIADQLNTKILGRFINPPRRISFDVLRYSSTTPVLATGYQIGSWLFQDMNGDPALVPAQVTRLNPKPDIFDIEVEEILFTEIGGGTAPSSPDVKTVIFDSNIQNVNLRTTYDSLYPTPTSGTTVNCNIFSSVLITSASTATPAFDVGSWPAGVTVNIIMSTGARIQGAGGAGATGSSGASVPGGAGSPGGTALYTRYAINLTSASAAIWGGGGGGGGGGGSSFVGGGGGGGGAGIAAGTAGVNGGLPTVGDVNPGAGTATTGGAGGISGSGADGGAGGGPGIAGTGGQAGSTSGQGAGGAVGAAIDGDSFVTDVGAPGDILGGQIN